MHPASRSLRLALLLLAALFLAKPALAQLPFYTDDPSVTDPWKWHFEFFNEYDALQTTQYPNVRQNTDNFKLNYGLPFGLELDIDAPYLYIDRAIGVPSSEGTGDTNMGIKWEFRKPIEGSHAPALGASLYIEIPTGNVRQQLGSGLTDYWLNFIIQEPLTDKTRINTNLGFLFAGNTSTGVIGTQNTRGHVYAGGVSLLHDFTPRLTVGGELYGGIADRDQLARSQLQAMVGAQYQLRNGLGLAFGVLGGKYIASPRIGVQAGFAIDLPDLLRPPKPE
ncbi:MAG: transporter [Candidatus Acidiferrales bacterium]